MDEQEPPTKGERERLSERINQVAAAGRIGTADRDIRLGNVASAQSRSEIDLMSRDLDQLEALTPAAVSKPYGTFDPSAASSPFEGASVVVTGSRRAWILTAVIALVSLSVAGGLGILAFIGHAVSSSHSTSHALPPAQTADAPTDGTDSSGGTSTGPEVPGDYALTARGLTAFLATYAKKFGTTRVVDLVLYPDYAVVDVPVAGGRGRQAGWLYRRESGWTSFGGVRAVFPGSETVDTRQLNLNALMRNIARARATLKVESPTQTYVILRFIPQAEPLPRVDIHVANGFGESGYLATRLDGTVERAYPFGD